MPLPKRRPNEKVLRPLHPNVGVEMAYKRALTKLIEEMHRSVVYWVEAKYRNNEPEIAQDAVTPASVLRILLSKLAKRWTAKFNVAAKELAAYFAKDVSLRTDAQMKSILKKAGMTVEFKMTPALRDIFKATINQNVSLIKSIPAQYLTQVEGIVARSVQTGRDLGQLSKDLQNQLGVSKRRAAFIARDQNNKATSALQRARQIELGITQAVWLHSHAGKVPRPSHISKAMNGQRYDVKKGMWDPDEKQFVWPGQLINCRCVGRSVIAGFS